MGHVGGRFSSYEVSSSFPFFQDNSRRQKQLLTQRFETLCAVLEERKGELLQALAREQEEKLQRVRGLIRQYGDHLEASSKLVESAIQSMEEPQMALYLQVGPGGGWQAVEQLEWRPWHLETWVPVLSLAPTCPTALGKSTRLSRFSPSRIGTRIHCPPRRNTRGIRSGTVPEIGTPR